MDRHYQQRPPFTAATPSDFRSLEEMIMRGVVRVLNIDFHKSVMVRFTTDDWKTFSDVPATYVPASCDGLSDRFNFALFAYRLQPGQRLFSALCYRVAGKEFWDSKFVLYRYTILFSDTIFFVLHRERF
jgi:Carbohydrate/starch-binding module (family 21)